MDESFTELEAELKALRPLRPAPDLVARITADLAAGPRNVAGPRYAAATNLNSWKWLGWRTAGLAAAIAAVTLISWINLERNPARAGRLAPAVTAAPATPREAARLAAGQQPFQPVAATNVLYDLKDEGTVYVNGDTPARRLRYRYLDTYTLRNPRTNASLKWSVPRDEVRVVPASLN